MARWEWRVVTLVFAIALGCERDDASSGCLLETAYVCDGGECYCVSDVLRENPMHESIAESACQECTSDGPLTADFDAGYSSEFGGIDHFSGDDDYGTTYEFGERMQ